MHLDLYSKLVITIIAVCLVVIAIHSISLGPEAKAGRYTTCNGNLTTNTYGGTKPMVGGYQVTIKCF